MNPLAFTISQEQNVDTCHLADLPLAEMLSLLNEHDARVPQAISRVLPQVEQAVRLIVAQMKSGGRLFYVGAGTSGRLGVLDSAECPPTFGTDPDRVQSVIAGGLDAMLRAVENVEDDTEASVAELRARGLNAQDVVLGIAASGRTPFVMSALDYARQIGAKTIALTTRGPGSHLAAGRCCGSPGRRSRSAGRFNTDEKRFRAKNAARNDQHRHHDSAGTRSRQPDD